MSAIDKIIDGALRNAETYTREENEGYREVYISYEDVEKIAYDVAKKALYEFEDILVKKIDACGVDIDIDTLMDETQKEIGL